MRSFTLKILDIEISFKSTTSHESVERAKQLIEDRFSELYSPGMAVTKEKILTLLALGLADDYLQSNEKLQTLERRLNKLTEKIEHSTAPVSETPES